MDVFIQINTISGGKWLKKIYKASMTVEASLCLPIFFVVLLALYYIICIMTVENNIQLDLSNTASDYACYQSKLTGLTTLKNSKTIVKWDTKKENICYVDQKEFIPFVNLGIRIYVPMSLSDYNGISMIPDKNKDNEYVYLTDNSKVYHRNKACTYLKPVISECMYGNIKNLRNASGGKYYICENCCKGRLPELYQKVYYTKYGNRIHINRACTKITHNIRRVRKNTLGNMPACHKCMN